MNPEIKLEIVSTGLKELFRGKYFDICEVDAMLRLTLCIPNEETYRGLRVLHCVHYSEMSPKLRGWLFNEVLGLFKEPGFPIETLNLPKELTGA